MHLLTQFSSDITVEFFNKHDPKDIPDPSVRLHQVHEDTTVIVREPSKMIIKADGMITDVAGLHLVIRAADCQNFAIYAPKHGVIGGIHSGWRGLVRGAIPSFFEALHNEWGIDASDVYVAAGPSLCKECAEFTEPKRELAPIDAKYFDGRTADLQRIATDQFMLAGVDPKNVERQEECTCCNPEQYLTYRGGDREDVKSGLSNLLVCTLNT